jgi:hypothetical protein
MGHGLGVGRGKGPIDLPFGKKREDKVMSDEKKAAQEGTERLMSFAVGINRRCEEDKQYTYGALAKASGVREDMLAPALVDVLVQASESK